MIVSESGATKNKQNDSEMRIIVKKNKLTRLEKQLNVGSDVKSAFKRAKSTVKAYHEALIEAGETPVFDPEAIFNYDYVLVSGFAAGQKDEDADDGLTAAKVVRTSTKTGDYSVQQIELYASAFLNTDNSVKAYTKLIIHEAFHVSDEGTKLFKTWSTTPRARRENDYNKRPHEAAAFKFADEAMKYYE